MTVKAFNKANIIITLVASVLASIISLTAIATYLDRYFTKPDINIQFCDSKENIILIKQPERSSAIGEFRLALQIVNNSDMTYNNVKCEFKNLSISETSNSISSLKFSINNLYTNEDSSEIDTSENDQNKFIPIELTTIHPGTLPLKQTFLASIISNYAPIIQNQSFGIDDQSNQLPPNDKINSNHQKSNLNNKSETERPMPIIEHKLAIRITGDNYPQRLYYLTIYFGRKETLLFYNRPIFEIDPSNNYKLKLIK